MTTQEFESMLNRLADAWSRRDYLAALAAFSADVQYADPLRYQISGREALYSFFSNDEGYDQRTTWHHMVFDEDQQIGVAEYTYTGTHIYHGTVWIRVHDGEITHWREYQHIDTRGWDEFAARTRF